MFQLIDCIPIHFHINVTWLHGQIILDHLQGRRRVWIFGMHAYYSILSDTIMRHRTERKKGRETESIRNQHWHVFKRCLSFLIMYMCMCTVSVVSYTWFTGRQGTVIVVTLLSSPFLQLTESMSYIICTDICIMYVCISVCFLLCHFACL